MIKRIVKLTFQPDKTDEFLDIFHSSKEKIRHFEGCHHLELWRAKNQSNIFFTYSYWADETALNNYRYSDLFKQTWQKTKLLFEDKPQAWSVELLAQLD